MTSLRFVGAFALSALLAVRTAGAQEPDPAPPAAVTSSPTAASGPAAPEWYGWQTLVSDATTVLTTIGVGASTGNAYLVLTNAGVGFGLGAPAVHLAHGRPLLALADLAMRAAGVFLGGFIGDAAMNCHAPAAGSDDHGYYGFCQLFGTVVGVGVGATAASIVDAAALSWETKGARGRPATVGQSFTVEPTVGWSRDGAAVGLQGRF